MTYTVRTSQNGYHRLPRFGPPDKDPLEIIVSKLKMSIDGDEVQFVFESVNKYPIVDVIGLIRSLNTGKGGPKAKKPERSRLRVEHPLEIWVRDPCYVVVMLDPKGPLRFRASGPAITTKVDCGDDN